MKYILWTGYKIVVSDELKAALLETNEVTEMDLYNIRPEPNFATEFYRECGGGKLPPIDDSQQLVMKNWLTKNSEPKVAEVTKIFIKRKSKKNRFPRVVIMLLLNSKYYYCTLMDDTNASPIEVKNSARRNLIDFSVNLPKDKRLSITCNPTYASTSKKANVNPQRLFY